MPKVTDHNIIDIEWADISNRRFRHLSYDHRTPGIHLSTVLRHIAISCRILKRYEDDEEVMPLRMALGMGVEEFLVTLPGNQDIIHQPGELCVFEDGMPYPVYVTPDGIRYADGPGELPNDAAACNEEFKTTWKKPRDEKEILGEWLWMNQLAGQLKAWQAAGGQDGMLVSRLHVVYMLDYKTFSPQYHQYVIQHSQDEVDGVWGMVAENMTDCKPE